MALLAAVISACGPIAYGESMVWQMMRRPIDGARMVCTQTFSASVLGSGIEHARRRVDQCVNEARRQGFVEDPSDRANR
jgi:hypothetical protein